MPHILDTNCLITFVTDRNPLQREIIADILNNAASLKEDLYIISNVFTEFVYVMTSVYKIDENMVSGMLSDLLDMPGVIYHHGYFPEKIIELWPTRVKDFGDAVIAAAAYSLDLSVYTVDKLLSKELTLLEIGSEIIE